MLASAPKYVEVILPQHREGSGLCTEARLTFQCI